MGFEGIGITLEVVGDKGGGKVGGKVSEVSERGFEGSISVFAEALA